MKNPLGSISKRDLVFISIILILLIVMVVSDTSVDILVNYDEEMLYVTSPRLNMDIPHADVLSAQFVDTPELGVLIDGYQHETYCTGLWKNDIWGEYSLCIVPSIEKCIVVELKDGGIMVFNSTMGIEKMQLFFQDYHKTCLNP